MLLLLLREYNVLPFDRMISSASSSSTTATVTATAQQQLQQLQQQLHTHSHTLTHTQTVSRAAHDQQICNSLSQKLPKVVAAGLRLRLAKRT